MDVNGVPLTLYLNHFRSMRGSDTGRWESAKRRMHQAERVAAIVDARWKSVNWHGNFLVCGDFNDKNDKLSAVRALTKHPQLVRTLHCDDYYFYCHDAYDETVAMLSLLFSHSFIHSFIHLLIHVLLQENVVERLPVSDQWTHHFKGDESYNQLDYILVSKTLASLPSNYNTKPVIVRHGLARRAERYTGPRYQVCACMKNRNESVKDAFVSMGFTESYNITGSYSLFPLFASLIRSRSVMITQRPRITALSTSTCNSSSLSRTHTCTRIRTLSLSHMSPTVL